MTALRASLLGLVLGLAQLGYAQQTIPATSSLQVREAGRCAMYDSCGRKSMFGGELPCPDNQLAREVSSSPHSPIPVGGRLGRAEDRQ